MRDIGIHIQQARQNKNMTQEDLAQAIHTTRQTVSNYETGRSRPDADTLVLLAQVLEVPAETLLYGLGWQRGPSRRQTVLFVILLLVFVFSLWYGSRAEYFLWHRESVEGKERSPLLWALYDATPALWFLLPAWLLPQALHLLGKVRHVGGPRWLHVLLLTAALALPVCLGAHRFFPNPHQLGQALTPAALFPYRLHIAASRFCYYLLPPVALGFCLWLTGRREEGPHA